MDFDCLPVFKCEDEVLEAELYLTDTKTFIVWSDLPDRVDLRLQRASKTIDESPVARVDQHDVTFFCAEYSNLFPYCDAGVIFDRNGVE